MATYLLFFAFKINFSVAFLSFIINSLIALTTKLCGANEA
jgi:hypothetical protein